ncbi:hypothetical protein [Nocardia sp. NPDC057272]|uniref:hypothetical protein n=1 Tax=Nocardia sp. NPDC057272 TaxID=3346079 RepID=UPI00363A1505
MTGTCASRAASCAARSISIDRTAGFFVLGRADKYPLLGEGVARAAAKLGVDPVKPITLIGVAALGEPDLLVEVEATAVLD